MKATVLPNGEFFLYFFVFLYYHLKQEISLLSFLGVFTSKLLCLW